MGPAGRRLRARPCRGGSVEGITRGAPWGSPRQASPTSSRRRARSRPGDSARSRWGSAGRNAGPQCWIPWLPASRIRNSSRDARYPCVDNSDDAVADEWPRARTIADNTCGISGISGIGIRFRLQLTSFDNSPLINYRGIIIWSPVFNSRFSRPFIKQKLWT